MKRELYLVIREGEALYASESQDSTECICNEMNEEAFNDAVEDLGLDDDMSEQDIDDASFMAGYNGYHYVSKVTVDDEVDGGVPVIATSLDGTEEDDFTTEELLELLKNSKCIEPDDFDYED